MKRKHRVDHIEKTFWDLYAFTTASLLFLKKGFWFDKTQCLDYLFVGSWKNFLWTRFHICLMVKNATTWIYSKKCTCVLSFKFPKDPRVWQHFCIGNAFHLKMVHAAELLKVYRLGGFKATIGYSNFLYFCGRNV